MPEPVSMAMLLLGTASLATNVIMQNKAAKKAEKAQKKADQAIAEEQRLQAVALANDNVVDARNISTGSQGQTATALHQRRSSSQARVRAPSPLGATGGSTSGSSNSSSSLGTY